MKIGLSQMNIIWEDKAANRKKVLEFIEAAKAQKVDLLLFPEMTLTGFSMEVDAMGENSHTEDSTIKWFQKEAKANSLYIAFGYIYKGYNLTKGKNNYVLVSPEGKLIYEYSKIHPFSYGLEAKYYDGGTEAYISKINNFPISTFICYDLRFPEIFQAVSHKAYLITVAANWPKTRREHWITLLKARAIENQCYIAGINRVGIGDNIEYCGDSLLIDPNGDVIAQGDNKEQLLTAELSLDAVNRIRDSFHLKEDRQDELYKTLKQKIQYS